MGDHSDIHCQADNAVRQKLKAILAQCSGQQPELIHDDSLLALDLYIDSLVMTEIIYDVEDKFSIVIKDNDIEQVNTVADFYQLIEGKI